MNELIVTPFCKEDINLLDKANSYLLGNDKFGVRLVKSFSKDEIKECKDICAKLNKNLYVNVNKIFLEEDLVELEDFIKYLLEIDVDGIFFSDMAVFMIAKKYNAVNKLIYASETQIVNYEDAKWYLSFGVKAVFIAKEATLKDLQTFKDKVDGNLGILAHGHFHMFYSKRKLIRNYFNQYGLEYEKYLNNFNMRIKEVTREDMYPIYQDENGTNIFSEEILCSIDHLSEIEGGSIKMYLIDGIFENVNYVKDVLDMYATYFETHENTFENLKEKYQDHRFTTGFFFKNIGLR